jgi:hypothetical protein
VDSVDAAVKEEKGFADNRRKPAVPCSVLLQMPSNAEQGVTDRPSIFSAEF